MAKECGEPAGLELGWAGMKGYRAGRAGLKMALCAKSGDVSCLENDMIRYTIRKNLSSKWGGCLRWGD